MTLPSNNPSHLSSLLASPGPPPRDLPTQFQVSAPAGTSLSSTAVLTLLASAPPLPPSSAPSTSSPGAAPPPPADAREFGHGAPPSYQYQHSMCTGMRKALLIGINYFGQRGQLRGCINDVRNMSGYLVTHFGYKREDMVILTDDQQNPISQPTKQNILRAMHWLVKDAQPNDSLFFHYSGSSLALPTPLIKTKKTNVPRPRWADKRNRRRRGGRLRRGHLPRRLPPDRPRNR